MKKKIQDDPRENQDNQPKKNKLKNNEKICYFLDWERYENSIIKRRLVSQPKLINPPSNLLKPEDQRLK